MRAMTLVGVNGDTIPLSIDALTDFAVVGDVRGIGFLAPEVSSITGAGDGETVRNVRMPSREIDIPLSMFASNDAEINAMQRRIVRAMRWRPGLPMPRFVVELDDGSYFLEVILVSPAMSGGYEMMRVSSSWLFTFRAPQPFWQAVDAVNLPVYRQAVVDPLLPELLPDVSLASASVLGTVEITNPGTEDAPVVWQVKGPFTTCAVTLADGRSWELDAVASGVTITVDTRKPKRVTDGDGANQYGLLAPAPKLFHLPPGVSTVDISVVGADGDTEMTGFFYPRFLTVF